MKFLISLILLVSSLLSTAQSTLPKAEHDSLWATWQNENLADTARLHALYEFGKKGYLFSRADSAYYFAELQYNFAKERGNKFYMAKAQNTKGLTFVFRGNFSEAIRLINTSIDLFNEIGEKKDAANALSNLANVYLSFGDYKKALETYDRALKVNEEINDLEQISKVLSNSAIVYVNQGNLKKAMELYQRCLRMKKELGNKAGEAGVLSSIGSIYNLEGNYPLALETYFKVLNMVEEIGDQKEIAKMHVYIAVIFQNQENQEQAIKHFQLSLDVYQKIGNQTGIANSLVALSNIYKTNGDYKKALDYAEKGLKFYRELGSKGGESNTLIAIANIYDIDEDSTKALNYFEKSLALKKEIGSKGAIASTLSTIGDFYFRRGDFIRSLEYYKQSLTISEEMGANIQISGTRIKIGNAHNKLNQSQLAVKNCKTGLELANESRIVLNQRDACECLTKAYKKLNNPQQALFYYEQMVSIKDSLFNEEETKKLTRLEMDYEFDKKEALAKLEQAKKDALAKAELENQVRVRNGFIIGFIIVLLFAGVFFKQRNQIKIGKKQSDDLLLNILPAEIADELKEKGKVGSKRIESVSVLFTDFKGFTAMSEKVSPKDLVEDLNVCFSEFDRIMEKYGIEKIKTIGDAYMAAGGLPLPDDKHAENAVMAAFEMRDFVEAGKAQKIKDELPFFEIRIGIHTGPVVAGIVGVKKFQYDIWGDTVNTASRMESSGAVGKVNISQTTYELLKDEKKFDFESRGKIVAKGKGELEMYFVSAS